MIRTLSSLLLLSAFLAGVVAAFMRGRPRDDDPNPYAMSETWRRRRR